MTADEIRRHLQNLGQRLLARGITADLYLFGGAVMVLVYGTRPGTHDIDAVFEPKVAVYKVARQMADELELDPNWLNDAVKGWLSPQGVMRTYLELPGVRVSVPDPAYLFAMKVLASRPEDRPDLEALIEHLGLQSVDQALDIVGRFYPAARLPIQAHYRLAELLPSP